MDVDAIVRIIGAVFAGLALVVSAYVARNVGTRTNGTMARRPSKKKLTLAEAVEELGKRMEAAEIAAEERQVQRGDPIIRDVFNRMDSIQSGVDAIRQHLEFDRRERREGGTHG